jgi:hypothetical protein
MNKPPKGDDYRRVNAHTSMLQVTAQDSPNMTVKIKPGSFWINGTHFIEYAGGNSPLIQAPTSGAKWTIVALNKVGVPIILDGEIATNNPELPEVFKDTLPLVAIYVNAGNTKITNDMIFDIRPVFSSGGYPINHDQLLGRDVNDAHPMSSITGLSAALATIPNLDVLNDKLSFKADLSGTSSPIFILNNQETGVPATDVEIQVCRGSLPSASIRFNEERDKWEFTNDGYQWHVFATDIGDIELASNANSGIVYLTTAPADSLVPIAVGANDPKFLSIANKVDKNDVYTKTQIDTVIASKANANEIYNKTQVDQLLNAKANDSNVYSKSEIEVKLSTKAEVTSIYNKTEMDNLLADKATIVNVYSKTEVNNFLGLKANSADIYTKDLLYTQSELDGFLSAKADKAETYTRDLVYMKTEVDNALFRKADVLNVYTKAEVDNKVMLKADIETTYTKLEVDQFLTDKVGISEVYTKGDIDTSLSNKANSSDVYTKLEVDNFLDGKAEKAEIATVLPEPTSSYRGVIFCLDGRDTDDDKIYICKKLSDNSYTWVQIG